MAGARWVVVFSDPDPLEPGAGWCDRLLYRALRLLKPGFRHCFAARPATAFDGWLVANWHWGRLDLVEVRAGTPVEVGPVTFGDYSQCVDAMAAAGLATTVWATAGDGERFLARGPATCVEAIKHLLSIGAPLAVTPWQLYRHLAKEQG